MQEAVAKDIIEKYLKGVATAEEINHLNNWYAYFDAQPDLYLPDTVEAQQAVAKKFSELKSKLGIT